jgi:hypothetical protein
MEPRLSAQVTGWSYRVEKGAFQQTRLAAATQDQLQNESLGLSAEGKSTLQKRLIQVQAAANIERAVGRGSSAFRGGRGPSFLISLWI